MKLIKSLNKSADNKGDAKQMGRKDGLVIRVELLNKNNKKVF